MTYVVGILIWSHSRHDTTFSSPQGPSRGGPWRAARCVGAWTGAGNLDVMWTFRRSIPPNWSIVSVEAPLADPLGGSSWWLIDSEAAAMGAPRAAEQIHKFINEFQAAYNLQPRFLAALGFSQGAGHFPIWYRWSPCFFAESVFSRALWYRQNWWLSRPREMPQKSSWPTGVKMKSCPWLGREGVPGSAGSGF